jgi:hypothetical protein
MCRKDVPRTPHRPAPGLVECLAIALPLLLVAALALENAGLPNFTPNIDLSQTVIMFVAIGVAVVGVVLAERSMARAWRALSRYRGALMGAALGSLLTVAGVAMMVHRIFFGS